MSSPLSHRLLSNALLSILTLLPALALAIEYSASPHSVAEALAGVNDSSYPASAPRDNVIAEYINKERFRYWAGWPANNRITPEKRQQITDFMSSNHPDVAANSKKVIYMFGGPDAIYPNLFFPNLEELHMVGLEKVGRLPDISDSEELVQYAQEIGKAFMSLPNRSYFVTRSMETQLKQHGVVTIAAVGLVSLGYSIEDVTYLDMSEKGELIEDPQSKRGVRIDYLKNNGQQASLYYFQQNLGPDEFGSLPGYLTDDRVIDYLENKNFDTGYYKAASYMPFGSSAFRRVNEIVTKGVKYVVQTDSALKLSEFDDEEWDTILYGQYVRPTLTYWVMNNCEQPLLKSAFDENICSSGDQEAISQLQKLRGDSKICDSVRSNRQGVTWMGLLPFKYGYPSYVTRSKINRGDKENPDYVSTNACGTLGDKECQSYASHLMIFKRKDSTNGN